MFFARKPKNRRLGREHVLDVKVRSSQVRAGRARVAAVALGVVFTLVLGTAACWRASGWALNRLVYENKAFSLDQIEVQTDGVISVPQLRLWSGVRLGDNLLALDLARVKRDLEMISAVHSASVERILPHTLRLSIVEREPVAQVNVTRLRPGGGFEVAVFLVDAEGWVILPLDLSQRSAPPSPADQLPLLSGLNGNEIQAGHRLESAAAQAALRLIASFERSAMASLTDLKRVDVSTPDVLVATTGQGAEITFGLYDSDRQVRRWQAIHELGSRMNKGIATLDLAVTNNIPVRWLEAGPPPPSNPKPPKPTRKRHV